MNKKISVVFVLIMSILLLSSCSNNKSANVQKTDSKSVNNDKKIEDIVYDGKLIYDTTDIKSMLDNTEKVILVEGLNYQDTIIKKGKPVPKTVYTAKHLQILDKGYDTSKDLYSQLTTYNNESSKVIMSGGIMTKGEVYDNLSDEYKDKSAGPKQAVKPSKEEVNTKVRVYIDNYLEFNNEKTYLIFAQTEDNNFYCSGYTVFEYDKDSKTFTNEFSKLQFKIEDLMKHIKQ